MEAQGGAGARRVVCVECGRPSDLLWRGWRAYRVDDPETNEAPTIGFYCPTCAQREFDTRRRPRNL
jgi:hypothetical protein